MKRVVKFVLISGLLILLLAGASAFWIYRLATTPYRNYSEDKLLITITSGTSLSSIARTLESRGVVPYDWLLRGLFKLKRTEGQSKAGDYVFDRPLTPMQVYDKLMKGETLFTVITLPEGSSVFDVQRILQEKGVGSAVEFEQALQAPQVLAQLHAIEPSAPGVEGFLFPETYFLAKKETPQKALLVMLHEFSRRYGEAERRRASGLGMSTLQVVTLASLVEKETGQNSERPLIAGVFHNRLKLRMLLQCDPTVIYALQLKGAYRGFLTRMDLTHPSPYNTYVSPGLPPGPICSPGAAAIHAALNPDTTDKLYFVSRNDGTHYFSATLAEHNRAVQKYRKN